MTSRHIIVASAALALLASLTWSDAQAGSPPRQSRACSNTTKVAYAACLYDNLDSYWIANGKCTNEIDNSDRVACLDDAKSALQAANVSCAEQRDARADLCSDLGEAPYDPKFEPAQFVNPLEIGRSVAPNPWYPLIPGRKLVYKSASEVVRVTITNKVKMINNVPCLVVLDRVEVNGALAESTIDWFAQDLQGNVWYCGEATAEYLDDVPVNINGSFQADVDGARPGLFAKATPVVGEVYRQEFDLGNAEDVAEVLSLTGTASTPVASCTNTCLVTEETTPLDPGLLEHKYYKAGVGFILQIKPATGERLDLVEVTNN
jgi:hypothetical protein